MRDHPKTEDFKPLPIVGKTVLYAIYDKDSSGYDFVKIIFEDETQIVVGEYGQCGEIYIELA